MLPAHDQPHDFGAGRHHMEGAAVMARRKPRQDEVEPAFLEATDQIGRGRDLDRRLDPWCMVLDLADRRNQAADRRSGDGADAHLAGKPCLHVLHLRLETVEFGEDGAGMAQEGRARLRRLHALRMAQEQRRSRLRLDLGQDARGGRLRDGERGRGDLQLAGLGDFQDQPQMRRFHLSGKSHPVLAYQNCYAVWS